MNKYLIILLFIITGISVSALSISFVGAQEQDSYVKHFTVKAYRYGYEPERLVVNQGDIVIITIQAVDAVHGFYLEDYEIRKDYITPGSPVTISFIADRMGMFRIHCSTICGSLHPFMTAQLEVQPSLRFLISTMSIFGLTSSFIIYLWMRRKE